MSKAVAYHSGAFPPQSLDWTRLIPDLGPTAAAVARYDGALSAIPNAGVLLAPLSTQEAVLSSRIEGTQATMGEVLEYEARAKHAKVSREREADIQEVLNYRRAMREAVALLHRLPLSLRVIREVHRVLMSGVRGEGRAPGEFRRVPNWIGPPGCSVEDARFVPISAGRLEAAMGRFEKYLHADAPDRLVQLAIAHAEFEALHPFLDGNGRLGRMLIPLFLWQHKLIQTPTFYISAHLEAHRDEYYERLLAVSRDADWTGWCRFFLGAVRTQADANHEKAEAILQLYEELKPQVTATTRSQFAAQALDWIFARPVFSSTDFIADTEIPPPTARRILNVIAEADIVRKIVPGSGRRPAVFAFARLMNIAEGRDLF